MAEFVDNSRDANAQNLYIYSEPRSDMAAGFMLSFHDDGDGMNHGTVVNKILI